MKGGLNTTNEKKSVKIQDIILAHMPCKNEGCGNNDIRKFQLIPSTLQVICLDCKEIAKPNDNNLTFLTQINKDTEEDVKKLAYVAVTQKIFTDAGIKKLEIQHGKVTKLEIEQ